MDVLAAARAFVSVSARGGFTDGAAALRIPQSVASRRIAALEKQVGAPLFDRSRRGAALTPAGDGLLPVARRLVELADEFLLVAEQGRARTVRIAMPRASIPALARIAAAGLQHGLTLECVEGDVPQRRRMLDDRVVAVAVQPARGGSSPGRSSAASTWTVPLGVAARPGSAAPPARLSSLRATRGDRGGVRVLHLLPEDDVPAVRDAVLQARDGAGVRSDQVALAPSAPRALAAVLGSDDLLLCSRAEAESWGLRWRALADPAVERVSTLVGDAETVRALQHAEVGRAIAAALGAEEPGA